MKPSLCYLSRPGQTKTFDECKLPYILGVSDALLEERAAHDTSDPSQCGLGRLDGGSDDGAARLGKAGGHAGRAGMDRFAIARIGVEDVEG